MIIIKKNINHLFTREEESLMVFFFLLNFFLFFSFKLRETEWTVSFIYTVKFQHLLSNLPAKDLHDKNLQIKLIMASYASLLITGQNKKNHILQKGRLKDQKPCCCLFVLWSLQKVASVDFFFYNLNSCLRLDSRTRLSKKRIF